MRLHICWGNYEGPHTHDIPLAKIIDICFKARPAGFSFEAANPRHEHEWEDLKQTRIPDGKVLIPGVIDSTTNFVEHPRLVAQRICRYADIVGPRTGTRRRRLWLWHLRQRHADGGSKRQIPRRRRRDRHAAPMGSVLILNPGAARRTVPISRLH